MKNIFVSLCVMLLAASAANAVVVGLDSFDYPDGPISVQNGGYGFSFDNNTDTQDGNVSIWENLAGGTADVVNGKVELYGGAGWNAIKRKNNADEWGVGPFKPENSDIFWVAATVTIDEAQTWLGVSAQDGGDERIKFGIPFQTGELRYFGVNNENTGVNAMTNILVEVGETYRIVGVLDFPAAKAKIWIDPDINDTKDTADAVINNLNMGNWISGVRLGNDQKATWDDVNVGTTYADMFLIAKPHTPTPSRRAEVEGLENLTLSWTAATDPANPGTTTVNPDLVSHKVYLSGPDDPNIFVADVSGWDSNLRVEQAATGVVLEMDKEYTWRVDQVMTGGTIVKGETWSFFSKKSTPNITTQPKFQIVAEGGTAEFSIGYNSISPLTSAQWYKDDAPLSNSDDISGADTTELTISNVSAEDVGDYLCKITNESNVEIASQSAFLELQAMLAYWPFTDGDPNNAVAGSPAIIEYGDPEPAEGIVGGGYAFDNDEGAFDMIYTDPAEVDYFNICNYQMTVSCWIKATESAWWGPFVARNGEDGVGWQIRRQGNTPDKVCFTTRGTPNDDGSASSLTVYDGEWHFAVGTFDGTVKKLYIDGVLNVTDDASGTITYSPSPVALAGRVKGSGEELTFEAVTACTLDEVKIYNYPLDPITIAQEYADATGINVCPESPLFDLSGETGIPDCIVDIMDFAAMANTWLQDNTVYPQN